MKDKNGKEITQQNFDILGEVGSCRGRCPSRNLIPHFFDRLIHSFMKNINTTKKNGRR